MIVMIYVESEGELTECFGINFIAKDCRIGTMQ